MCGLSLRWLSWLFWHAVTLVLKCHFPIFPLLLVIFLVSSRVQDIFRKTAGAAANLSIYFVFLAGWRSRKIDPNWQWVRRQAPDST